MPIYEYQCSNCAHQMEIVQKMSDEPIKKCPVCHTDSLTKLISAAGFQLKGTGWYQTDYRDKPKVKPEENKKDQTEKSSGETSSKETATKANDSSKESSNNTTTK